MSVSDTDMTARDTDMTASDTDMTVSDTDMSNTEIVTTIWKRLEFLAVMFSQFPFMPLGVL